MNRDSSLKATSKFSEQSQLPVINGKGNGQLMYKKKALQEKGLLWRAKSAAKAQKSAAIDLPFSGTFGLLRGAKNYRYMRFPFKSNSLLAVG